MPIAIDIHVDSPSLERLQKRLHSARLFEAQKPVFLLSHVQSHREIALAVDHFDEVISERALHRLTDFAWL